LVSINLTAMVGKTRHFTKIGDCMTLLTKKVTGLGLVLLGGLTVAHGGAAGQAWEIFIGALGVIIGAALLAMKIVRRNITHAGQADR
jgi:hypothetical protein